MTQTPDFADGCRPSQHSVSHTDSCRPDFRGRLQLSITEFLRTSPEANLGEKYIVRGRHELSGGDAVSLGAVVSGTSFWSVRLTPCANRALTE